MGLVITRSVKNGKEYDNNLVPKVSEAQVNDTVRFQSLQEFFVSKDKIVKILAGKSMHLAPTRVPDNPGKTTYEQVEGEPLMKISGKSRKGNEFSFYKAWVASGLGSTGTAIE